MKHKKKLVILITFVAILVLFSSFPVFAAELTEADVEKAVAEQGKDAVTGNVFIWFLCAIAFLKVSQKIDSFMASLGINVGNTGGNMMAELLIAGRGISNALHHTGGGGSYRKPSSPGDAAVFLLVVWQVQLEDMSKEVQSTLQPVIRKMQVSAIPYINLPFRKAGILLTM